MSRSHQRHCDRGRGNLAAPSAALGIAASAALAGPANATTFDRKALEEALDDEYRAEATYQAIIDKFGAVRPFINIIDAERRHAGMVKNQFSRLGIEPPENPYLGEIEAPESLQEACKNGVEAEIENIALYDRLLPKVSDPQIRETFGRLQAASRNNHLPAFRRCVARGGAPGMGQGRGGGRGYRGGWR